jgi:hypothetical protein
MSPSASSNSCSSAPVVLAHATSPSAIALDGSHVYWSGYEGGPVAALPIGGGAASTLYDSNFTFTVAVDATRVYSADAPGATGTVGAGIVACAKAGCGGVPTLISTGPATVQQIAVDATNVYWTAADGTVMKAPVAGGAATQLAKARSTYGIAVARTSVYFSDPLSRQIVRVPIDGGAPTLVAQAPDGPGTLVTDASNVYFTNGDDVVQASLDGRAQQTIVTGLAAQSFGIAVDDSSVYFTSSSRGIVAEVPIGGGAVTTLACNLRQPWGVAVNGRSVYWVDPVAGAVMAVPK